MAAQPYTLHDIVVMQDLDGVTVEDTDRWAITFRSTGEGLVFEEGSVGE